MTHTGIIMKTRLAKTVLLLATLALLPLVEGCYGDKVNVAAAWVPADLQGIVVVSGSGTAAGGSGASSGYLP